MVKILVIDDEKGITGLFDSIFTEHQHYKAKPHTVLTAFDVPSGLELISNHQDAGLIFLDYNFKEPPARSGVGTTIIDTLYSDPVFTRAKGIPIVAMTTQEGVYKKYVEEAKVKEILIKPVPVSAIVAAFEAHYKR
ncbi:hypothetical protein JXB02_04670 [Candidatus Woesearchaeota archaeon]|nr:hypothetical protein [Candidatus Woesearchaeota archaeon]